MARSEKQKDGGLPVPPERFFRGAKDDYLRARLKSGEHGGRIIGDDSVNPQGGQFLGSRQVVHGVDPQLPTA